MDSKKIGLLTLPLIDNYGGIIQIASLYTYLKNEGFDVYYLDKKYKISKFKQTIRKLLQWNPIYKVFDYNNHAKKHRYIRFLNDFKSSQLKSSTSELYSREELTDIISMLELDAVIVGSDQVWRMLYVNENYADYFLEFVNSKKIKKISYAASFGTDTWEDYNVTDKIKMLLNDFNAISVREDTGISLCKNVFNVQQEVHHVLDPTFLPDRSYYDDIIKSEFFETRDIGLFNYVLDKSPKKNEIIDKVAKHLGLNIDSIYLENNLKDFSNKKVLKPSIGEWLYHFKQADFIITDSFHGTIFSIIFNKQFIAIGNKTRGLTRFISLLKALNLSNRFVLVENNDNDYLSIVDDPINYMEVDMKISELKLKSTSFIKNALS